MIKQYNTSFTVYPEHTNCHSPLIFGGAFYGQLDKAAATAVKRLLYESKFCKAGVTHRYEGAFHKPCYMGDLIFVEASITSLGKKSIVIEVLAFRENPPLIPFMTCSRELVAEAKFVFVSIQNADELDHKPKSLPYMDHGLTLTD